MHVLMVTLMVTIGSVIDQSPIYKVDLWIFTSETPEFRPWYLSVGIRLFQDSPGWFRGSYGYLFRESLVMMVMYLSVPFISELLSWICGYIFLQRVVVSSEVVTQCSGCSDDLEDGTVHCIHTSTSFTFCIYLHLTHVYPYAGIFRSRSWLRDFFAQT